MSCHECELSSEVSMKDGRTTYDVQFGSPCLVFHPQGPDVLSCPNIWMFCPGMNVCLGICSLEGFHLFSPTVP